MFLILILFVIHRSSFLSLFSPQIFLAFIATCYLHLFMIILFEDVWDFWEKVVYIWSCLEFSIKDFKWRVSEHQCWLHHWSFLIADLENADKLRNENQISSIWRLKMQIWNQIVHAWQKSDNFVVDELGAGISGRCNIKLCWKKLSTPLITQCP